MLRRPPLEVPLAGVLTVLLGTWAGIVAFVGPEFGFRLDRGPSWTWDANHGWLHFAPGLAAVIGGLWMLQRSAAWRRSRSRSRVVRTTGATGTSAVPATTSVPATSATTGPLGRHGAPGEIVGAGSTVGTTTVSTEQVPAAAGYGAALWSGALTVLAGAWLVVGPIAWPVLMTNAAPVFRSSSPLHDLAREVGANLGPGVLLCVLGSLVIGSTASWQRLGRGARAEETTPAAVEHPIAA